MSQQTYISVYNNQEQPNELLLHVSNPFYMFVNENHWWKFGMIVPYIEVAYSSPRKTSYKQQHNTINR